MKQVIRGQSSSENAMILYGILGINFVNLNKTLTTGGKA